MRMAEVKDVFHEIPSIRFQSHFDTLLVTERNILSTREQLVEMSKSVHGGR